MEDTSVEREVVAPPSFGQYLRDNIPRFYRSKKYRWQPRLAREQRVQMIQHQIQALQSELERVQAGEDSQEESPRQGMERRYQEYLDALKGAKGYFDLNLQMREGVLSFGTWTFGKVHAGCLG
jgi:hypothetical protein